MVQGILALPQPVTAHRFRGMKTRTPDTSRDVRDCVWGDSLQVYLASLAPQAKAPTLAGAVERHPESPGSNNLQGRGSRN